MVHSPLPLEGIRAAEFGEVAVNPFCGILLADLGVGVIKIERPDSGDSQIAAMERVRKMDLPTSVRTKTIARPLVLDGGHPPICRRPPASGEHTDEIRLELARVGPEKEKP